MEELLKWAGIYIGVGSTYAIAETFNRINGKGMRINRVKIIAAWLPALINRRVGLWVYINK